MPNKLLLLFNFSNKFNGSWTHLLIKQLLINKKNIKISLIYRTFNHKCLIITDNKKTRYLNFIFYACKFCVKKRKKFVQKVPKVGNAALLLVYIITHLKTILARYTWDGFTKVVFNKVAIFS